MIEDFYGYYKPDFEKLWDEAIFVPDANVILSLYRFSESASGDLIQILNKLKDKQRIWMPYQFAFEYHENLLTIFRSIKDEYGKSEKLLRQQSEELCRTLKQTLNNFKNRNGFESMSLMSKVETDLDNIIGEYSKFAEAHCERLRKSPIEEKIARLLNGAYGEAYTSDRVEELLKEGDRRFGQGIPPVSSKDVKNKPNPYGDLIAWFQIIDYAKENKRSVIVITDDKDWYVQKEDVTHPHPRLRKELHDIAGVGCYIYKIGRFMEYARKYLEAQVSDETIDEADNREKYSVQQESVGSASESARIALSNLRTLQAGLGPALANIKAVQTGLSPALRNLKDLEVGLGPALANIKAIDTGFSPVLNNLEALELGLGPARANLKAVDSGFSPALFDEATRAALWPTLSNIEGVRTPISPIPPINSLTESTDQSNEVPSRDGSEDVADVSSDGDDELVS